MNEFLHLIFALDDAVMPFAEDVGIEGDELLHRVAPFGDVGAKNGRKRTMNILTEEHSYVVNITICGYGARRMAWCVNQLELEVSQIDDVFVSTEF